MTALDSDLLRRYSDEKSEEAFAELVRRHVDPVYSAALRQVNGDAHLAQDVAQMVFTELSRKAAQLLTFSPAESCALKVEGPFFFLRSSLSPLPALQPFSFSAFSLRKVPSRSSSKACWSWSWVFMTMGPYQATGS